MGGKTLRLAMGQLLVTAGQPENNLQHARRMIQEAANRKCDIIVLPECMDLGWTYPGAKRLAKPIPGNYSDVICEAARQYGIHVVAGLTEKSGDALYNAAIIISPAGKILSKHRKINEVDIALDLYEIGDSLSVTKLDKGYRGS